MCSYSAYLTKNVPPALAWSRHLGNLELAPLDEKQRPSTFLSPSDLGATSVASEKEGGRIMFFRWLKKTCVVLLSMKYILHCGRTDDQVITAS